MDWFPLYNSLRIALIAGGKGCVGCSTDIAAGTAAYGCGVFSTYAHGTQTAFWCMGAGDVWYKNGHDLVFRDFCSGSSGISAYVPDSPRCF